jgi:hypothetical protein
MGNLSGSSTTFREIFFAPFQSPPTFAEFVEYFRNLPGVRGREVISKGRKGFSDEHLLRRLIQQEGLEPKLNHVARNLNIEQAWVDRSWWPTRDALRENADVIEAVNFPRPFLENRVRILEALSAIDHDFVVRQLPIPLKRWEFRIKQLISKFTRRLIKGEK